MLRWIVGTIAILGLGAGVLALREATLSTHQPVPADSRVDVVLRARSHGGEPGQTVEEMVSALLLMCRLEVTTDPAGALQPLGDERYRMVFRPGLDRSDRRQFRGCLEDWRVDHLSVDVISLINRGDAPSGVIP